MIIYQIRNKENGMSYIGQTKQNLNSRISQHIYIKSKIGLDLKKLGKDKFDIIVLEECKDKEEMNKLEEYWILKLNTIYPLGYNSALVDKKYGKFNGFYGKKHSKETILKNKKNQSKIKPIMCNETGTIYLSLRECERITGMSRTNLVRLCNNNKKSRNGLSYRYVNKEELISDLVEERS